MLKNRLLPRAFAGWAAPLIVWYVLSGVRPSSVAASASSSALEILCAARRSPVPAPEDGRTPLNALHPEARAPELPRATLRAAPLLQFRGANSADPSHPGETDCNSPAHW